MTLVQLFNSSETFRRCGRQVQVTGRAQITRRFLLASAQTREISPPSSKPCLSKQRLSSLLLASITARITSQSDPRSNLNDPWINAKKTLIRHLSKQESRVMKYVSAVMAQNPKFGTTKKGPLNDRRSERCLRS